MRIRRPAKMRWCRDQPQLRQSSHSSSRSGLSRSRARPWRTRRHRHWRSRSGATPVAVAVLAPVAVVRRRGELAGLLGPARRDGLFCVLAGFALAAHFLTWVPSTKMTTVAVATALAATQPVWQGIIAVGQGRRLPGLAWVGIIV